MCCMRFTMSSSDRKEVEHQLKTAQHLGNLRQVKYLLAILAVMDGQVAAIALAEHGAFGMGRPQLATLCDGLAIRTDQPLPHIEAAAVALGQADDRGEFGALDGVADLLGLRAVIG